MRSRGLFDRLIHGSATAWVLAFWIGCVAIPVLALLARVQSWGALFDPIVLQIAAMTAGQAFLSAGVAGLIGLPLGIWIGSSGVRERRWAQAFLALPFGVPSVVAGLAWVVLLGRSGIFSGLEWAYSFKAVILAHVVFNVPWVALWVAQSREYLPEERIEASRTLGAQAWGRFRFVVWPHVRWAFFSSACQAFVFCAMSFALILILGGGPPVQTLEVALFSNVRFGTLDLARAVACAVWELAVTMLPWCFVAFFQVREVRFSGRSSRFAQNDWRRRNPLGWIQIAIAALFFLPYLSVLTTGRAWLATEYSPLWQEVIPALRISGALALATAIGALLTAVAAVAMIAYIPHERRGLRGLLIFLVGVPSGISALVLGLGLWLAYGKWVDPFGGSFVAIVALQMVIFSPIAFRVLWPVARDRRSYLLEAAATLGASKSRAFWLVEWPRWRAPLFSAFGMVAGASLGEVAAVSLFYSENLIPLPLLISRWSAQYRFADAQSVAVLLLFLCSGVILLAYPLREKA